MISAEGQVQKFYSV